MTTLLLGRLYLKAAGRIPTHEELTTYLANSSKNKKKQNSCFKLLSHQLLTARCLIGGQICSTPDPNAGGNQIGAGQLYVQWVKNQVNNNVPFDEMAFKLITAEGCGRMVR